MQIAIHWNTLRPTLPVTTSCVHHGVPVLLYLTSISSSSFPFEKCVRISHLLHYGFYQWCQPMCVCRMRVFFCKSKKRRRWTCGREVFSSCLSPAHSPRTRTGPMQYVHTTALTFLRPQPSNGMDYWRFKATPSVVLCHEKPWAVAKKKKKREPMSWPGFITASLRRPALPAGATMHSRSFTLCRLAIHEASCCTMTWGSWVTLVEKWNAY